MTNSCAAFNQGARSHPRPNRSVQTAETETPIAMSSIDHGHTAWLLTSMALVQLMLPGLAFFYAGLLHRTSVRSSIHAS